MHILILFKYAYLSPNLGFFKPTMASGPNIRVSHTYNHYFWPKKAFPIFKYISTPAFNRFELHFPPRFEHGTIIGDPLGAPIVPLETSCDIISARWQSELDFISYWRWLTFGMSWESRGSSFKCGLQMPYGVCTDLILWWDQKLGIQKLASLFSWGLGHWLHLGTLMRDSVS